MNEDNLKLAGDFLRAKRESLSPETIGLKKLARTRTRGLRRDDVAELSGISTVWYSKIERGQATGISSQVLISIAEALQLTKLEYEYLCNLISPQARNYKKTCHTVSEHTAQLLAQLNPLPSVLMNDYFDIVACNHAFSLMIGFNIDTLPVDEKNYLYLTISHAEWQQFLCIDDDKLTQQITKMAGFLRDTFARRPDDKILQQKIDGFRVLSPIFEQAWTRNIVRQPEERSYQYKHAMLGEILLSKQLWWNFSGDACSRLNIYYPVNDADHQRFREIMP